MGFDFLNQFFPIDFGSFPMVLFYLVQMMLVQFVNGRKDGTWVCGQTGEVRIADSAIEILSQGVFLCFYIDGKEPAQQIPDAVIVWIDRLHGCKIMVVCFSGKPSLEKGAADIVDFFINPGTPDDGLGNDVRVGQPE